MASSPAFLQQTAHLQLNLGDFHFNAGQLTFQYFAHVKVLYSVRITSVSGPLCSGGLLDILGLLGAVWALKHGLNRATQLATARAMKPQTPFCHGSRCSLPHRVPCDEHLGYELPGPVKLLRQAAVTGLCEKPEAGSPLLCLCKYLNLGKAESSKPPGPTRLASARQCAKKSDPLNHLATLAVTT